ncbi:MAG: corrinoid protein [Chloroflexi bacterium]|nr:corrinoid protein [Chloroflexota bacterium]
MTDPIIQTIYNAVLEGDRPRVQQQVKQAIEANLDLALVLNEGMIAAMKEVGDKFSCGEYYVPEMLISARAMQDGLALVKPRLMESQIQSAGKVVAGTVKGDLHDIGKTLVCMMLEGAGFEINDLGTDVAPEKFVEVVATTQPNIVAMSALLTTTMPNMQATIRALEKAGLRDKVKVIVGGAPVTEKFVQQIGADGYAPDAGRAVALAKSLVG